VDVKPSDAPRAAMTPRERLLDAAVEYVAEHGIGDLTLRRLADALGTSHRMLIYHFGSRTGLLVAVAQEVEERQRRAMAELGGEPGATPEDVARSLWRRLTDPALWPLERSFFELYGRALHGSPDAAPFLEGIVENWIGPASHLAVANGVPADEARAAARLGLAVVRGLLLDLLATGDREGVDQAYERFLRISSDQQTQPAAS
jgi:AcrR family transcriptional regulator